MHKPSFSAFALAAALFTSTFGCTTDDPATGVTSADSDVSATGWYWPGGAITYYLDPTFTADPQSEEAFVGAMTEYTDTTGLSFAYMDHIDPHIQAITFTNLPASMCTHAGTSGDPVTGFPVITGCLANPDGSGGNNRTTYAHEMGHALGMPHEQQRADRDTYVYCWGGNIDPAAECVQNQWCDAACVTACKANPCLYGDFGPEATSTVYAPYDLSSIMQYEAHDVSKNGHPTETQRSAASCEALPGTCIPDHGNLSIEDINTVRQAYEVALDKSEDASSNFGQVAVAGDFDHDGYVDLAVSAPNHVGHNGRPGAVYLFKGTHGRQTVTATTASTTDWSTSLVPWKILTPEVLGQTSQDGEQFGAALIAGDFDGDGTTDLAIGAPGRNASAGAIYLAFGHAYVQPAFDGSWNGPTLVDGLTATSATELNAPSYMTADTINANSHPGDKFGSAFAFGDFDNDGVSELAVASPNRFGVGGVAVLKHGPNHMTLSHWLAPTSGTASGAFGTAIAAYDMDGDGILDFAVGAPAAGVNGGGAVYTFLSGTNNFAQAQMIQLASPVAGDDFGSAMVNANFRGVTAKDLAIGAPGRLNQGRIELFTWTGTSLSSVQLEIDQTIPGGTNVTNDRFGDRLAAANLHGATKADLVAGVPYKTLPGYTDAGYAYTLTATSAGFTSGKVHAPPYNRANGHFGSALASGDFNHDGGVDLVIGAMDMNGRNTSALSGMIMSCRGSANGLTGETLVLNATYAMDNVQQ